VLSVQASKNAETENAGLENAGSWDRWQGWKTQDRTIAKRIFKEHRAFVREYGIQ